MSFFQTIQPQRDTRGRWCVTSPFWSYPVEDERTAERICETIKGAYEAGRRDKSGEILAALGLHDTMEGKQ